MINANDIPSDGYDPTMRDDVPYKQNSSIPSMYGQHTLNESSFIDLNNIGKYQRPTHENGSNSAQVYQNELAAARTMQRPNLDFAGTNIQMMNNALKQLGNIAEVNINGTNGNNELTPIPPSNASDINNVIDSITNTLNLLNNVDLWIPQAKKEYTKKLSAVAQPIIKALSVYASTLKKMS